VITASQRTIGGNHQLRNASGINSAFAGSRGASGIAVQKYGGSSLATVANLRQVARRVVSTHRSGQPTVVVVSARGRTTDELLQLAASVGRERTGREADQLLATGEAASAALLAIALQDFDVPAVSLTGTQAGIRAAGKPGSGVIVDIDACRLRHILDRGQLAVVAGFQGGDDAGDVITLGRGGSDTTAVALAAVLGASHCEICTDVPGVATADPRVVGNARVLPAVDVGVMAEMSFAGARVLHSRAVELAAMCRVELHVRSSTAATSSEPGTIIPAGSDRNMLESRGVVVAIAHDLDVARVLVHCGSRRGDLAAEILAMLSECAIPLDLVARSGPYEDEFRMGFTMRRKDSEEALSTVRQAMAGIGATIRVDENVGKVSLIGMGLLNRPEYVARMLSALSAAGISTSWISTSQIRTSVVIPQDRVLGAVRLLHEEFQLDRDHLEPVSVTAG
jgi:aspartate kinase